MRKIVLFIAMLLVTNIVLAQQYKYINYKAIITDNGSVLVNQSIDVQFSVLLNGITMVYQEDQSATTDANGIIILNIGQGSVLFGDYEAISWSDKQYLKVEIDTGSGYEDFGTTSFKSVPYAKYAENGNGAKELNDLSDAISNGFSTFIGNGAGVNDDGADNYNTGIGTDALHTNTTGYSNTANGYNSLYSNTEGDSNTANGAYSLYSNTEGHSNTVNGYMSLYFNTTGYQNTANGSFSLYSNTSGSYNTANGNASLKNNTTGIYNTAIGSSSGYDATGSGNIFLGYQAGYNETGDNKLYIENSNSATPLIGGDFSTDEVTINGSIAIVDGTQGANKVLTSDAGGKASWETAVTGATELNDLSDAVFDGQSIYIGYNSGINDDNSNYNAALGWKTMENTTSGRQNVSVGAQTMILNETGSYNVALGEGALYKNISGSANIAIGNKAGFNTLGDNNIFIGYKAGLNETGSDKLYIENTDSATPLIGGDFSTDEVTINGAIEITGVVNGKITTTLSGDSDMKAYLFGSVGLDGVTFATSSSDGFTASQSATGRYRISSANLGVYTVTATMRYGFIGFITVEKFSTYIDVLTYDIAGVPVDRGFDFIVFKR